MSHHIRVTVLPTGADDCPRAHLGGRDHSIPVIEFSDSKYATTEVSVQVSNHPDPGAYLRALSEVALDLAAQYDAVRAVAS